MRKRILVADNEICLLNSIKINLSNHGYEVTTAQNGWEALGEIISCGEKGSAYDLLVTDLHMPDMSGMELLDELEKQGVSIPAIAMTGFGDKDILIDLIRKGCVDYLDKPFGNKELAQRVAAALGISDTAHTGRAGRGAHPADIAVMDEPGWTTIVPDFDESDRGEGEAVRQGAADRLRSALVERFDNGELKYRFDFKNVKSIDTMSLSVFLCFGQMVGESTIEGRLEIVNATADVAELFANMGADNFFDITH